MYNGKTNLKEVTMSTTTTQITSFSASPISFDGANDIMILTNKNIVSSITDAHNLPLCAIASYKMVEDISSATSSAIGRIDEISSLYFKLSADNNVTGSNTFNNLLTFTSISVNDNVSAIQSNVYTTFSKVFNCLTGKLSDIINGVDTIETVGNIYRTIHEIIIHALLKTTFSYNDSVNDVLINTVKKIIGEKPELRSNSIIQTFDDTNSNDILNTYTIEDYLNVLKAIVDTLDISTYSLADKFKQIEESIDALDSAFTNELKLITATINNISNDISNITSNIALSTNTGLSIITNISLIGGIVNVHGKELLSADIKDLPEYANNVLTSIDTITTNINTISSTYALSADVPLSTSQLINNGDGEATVFMLNNKLSIDANYDDKNYNIYLKYDGNTIATLNANKFIEDSFLSSVLLCGTGTGAFLQFNWITYDTVTSSYQLHTPTLILISNLVNNLYIGGDGIDVNDFTISVDYAKVAALSIVNKLCADFANISTDMNNVTTYAGHITIDSNDRLSSISEILGHANLTHGASHGQIRNGSMYEVNWRNLNELSTNEAKASAYITTKDDITLHHKDVIIIHQHDNNKQYIDADDPKLLSYIKVITAVDWPLFYSLCCAVDNSVASVELSIDDLSTALSNKIVIDGKSLGVESLSINNISLDEFHNLVIKSETLSNVLYVVSSDELNMYDERIIHLADGLCATDAVNVKQVTLSVDTEKRRAINAEEYLSTAIDNKIWLNDVSANSLSIQYIALDDYHQLVNDDKVISNVLYVVSSDNLNMYGERITNLADPISANDAVNKKYVDDISTYLSNDYIEKIEAKSNIYLSSITNTGISGGKLNLLNLVKFDSLNTYTMCCDANPELVTISDLVLIEEDLLDAESKNIINVASPSADTDAANKKYVDDSIDNIYGNIETKILSSDILSIIYDYGELTKLDEINCGLIVSALYELIKIFHD